MMIEESETPDAGSHSDTSADVLAERRARRNGDPIVTRRAEAAEAAVRNLETHLAALEQRLEEVARERERIAQQLIERESDVRGAKQREYAEQQLRVEAEERGERLQREMRSQIQELGNRLEETERDVRELSAELTQLRERDARLTPIVRELMDVAAGLRAGFERELTALREELQQQVVWERETYVRELTAMGARMEDLRFELTRTADDLRAQLKAEPLDDSLLQHTSEPESEREAVHRREMADALVAAVERLRARVAEVKEAEADEQADMGDAQAPTQQAPVVTEPVVHEEPITADAPTVTSEPEPVVEPLPVETQAPTAAVAESTVVDEPSVVNGSAVVDAPALADEPAGIEEPVIVEPPVAFESSVVQEEPVTAEDALEGPVSQVLPVEPVAAVEEPVIVHEPAVIEEPVAVVEEPDADEESPDVAVKSDADEESADAEGVAASEQSSVEEQSSAESPLAGGLSAPISAEERLAPLEPTVPGLGPGAALSARAVSSEPVALQSRLLAVPEKRTSWLAPAIRRLAAERDAKLAAELVIELIPAQREMVDGPLNYEIKIRELGTFYVALDPGQATISREPRGSIDFSLEGPVAAFSELAAGGAARRHRGLRIRKGRRSARRFLRMRRRPIALADLASAGVDVWPGLLLLAMAEAVDPSWTSDRHFELAFEIQGSSGIVIYVRINDGEPVMVSRTAAGDPVATISLSGHALICLLAGTQPPPEDRTLVTGDATSVDIFLQWTARAQGLTVADA
jgi:hypothetical protein